MRSRALLPRRLWGVWITGVASVLALCAVGAGPAAAGEIRKLEVLGVVALAPDETRRSEPRDAALESALWEAVQRVAREMLPDAEPGGSKAMLSEALGTNARSYTTRFRILEDRGARPALFVHDAEQEYVVVAEVHVDTERVRSRLRRQGLMVAPSGESRRVLVRLVVEDLRDYAAYQTLREKLMKDVGVRSVIPVEMQPGRATLAVDCGMESSQLLAELMRAASPELGITQLPGRSGELTLRLDLRPTPAARLD